MFCKKTAVVASQSSPLGDSLNIPEGWGLFSLLQGVLAQPAWHIPGTGGAFTGSSRDHRPAPGLLGRAGHAGLHSTGERKARRGIDIPRALPETGRKRGFLRRDKQFSRRKHGQERLQAVLCPMPTAPFLSVCLSSQLHQVRCGSGKPSPGANREKRNTSIQMHLASGDMAPAHQDAPQLMMLLHPPSGPHRSNVPQFIQTPRAWREAGARGKSEKSLMHLLKIILVTAENCWQLQPRHLSSCHVASNPSLLEASLEMSWPQYQSPTRRMGGNLFLEIQPSEHPA